MRPRDAAMMLALSGIWGASYLFIRVAAPAMGPAPLMAIRVLLAGIVLAVAAALLGQLPESLPRWRDYLLLSGISVAAPFTLIATAELALPASLASMIMATAPLLSAMVEAIWLRQPLTPRRVLGLFAGLAGVAVLVGWSPVPLTGESALAAGALLLAAFCYGLGAVYTRVAFSGHPPLGLATVLQLGAGVLLTPIAVATLPPVASTDTAVIASVLTLALVCTAVAYLLFFSLLDSIGPTGALMVGMLIPFFGVLWGALFLGESVTVGAAVGLAIVLASVWLVSGPRLAPAEPMARRTFEPPPEAA